jgi:4'-phosphopantetheinyl transferase
MSAENPTIEIEVLTIGNLDEPLASSDLQELSSRDLARCLSFKQNADRWRFVAARRLVSKTLDRMVGPGWSIHITANGRPYAVTTSGSSIDFNIAHASCYAIIAATREGHVGIDIEPVSAFADFEDIVEFYLAPPEAVRFWQAPPSERQALAAQIWVSKEAILKAEGSGLMRDPRGLVLSQVAADGIWRPVDGVLCALPSFGILSCEAVIGVAWRPSRSGDLRHPRLLYRQPHQ